MTPRPENLPDNPQQLKQLVIELVQTLQKSERETEKLRHHVEQLLRQIYGRKSEKLDPNQVLLFALGEEPEEKPPEFPPPPSRTGRRKTPGHGRRRLPKDLPRDRREYPLPEDQIPCPCCGETRVVFGEEVTEQLEYIPASAIVIEHVRLKYVCRSCQGEVAITPPPPQVYDKALPGPGMLAHVVVSKYGDHLPLNRQEEIFQRQGLEIARSTMGDWVARVAELLYPVAKTMKTKVLASRKVHTDDTHIRVQDRSRKQTRKATLWCYVGDDAHPYAFFHYTERRTRDGPAEMLKDYQGYLQADAYGGYDGIYAGGQVKEVACWAHARRHLYDARETDPLRAHQALAYIGRLYQVEVEAKKRKLDVAGRHALRQEKSVSILDEFETWLQEQSQAVLPKSPFAKAMGYVVRQWEALRRYTEDGILHIDNNLGERTLRRIAVGRHNWLFTGSDAGGRRAAVIYSIIATCKEHEVNPFEYIRDVIQRVSTHPMSRIDELLPDRWKKLRAAEQAQGESPTPKKS